METGDGESDPWEKGGIKLSLPGVEHFGLGKAHHKFRQPRMQANSCQELVVRSSRLAPIHDGEICLRNCLGYRAIAAGIAGPLP